MAVLKLDVAFSIRMPNGLNVLHAARVELFILLNNDFG
jgi:hypothetical protein